MIFKTNTDSRYFISAIYLPKITASYRLYQIAKSKKRLFPHGKKKQEHCIAGANARLWVQFWINQSLSEVTLTFDLVTQNMGVALNDELAMTRPRVFSKNSRAKNLAKISDNIS